MTDLDVCPECGEDLDGFGPCSCALSAPSSRPRPPDKPKFHGSMREMVARKLSSASKKLIRE